MKNTSVTTSSKKFILNAFLLLITFCYIFSMFAEELVENELHNFDFTIINWAQSFISVKHTEIMEAFTFLGSINAVVIIVIITVILMVLNRKNWETLFFILAVSGSALFNFILKWIFHRARPLIHPIIKETGYSFPSGHSMVSIVMYGMLTYFLILFFEKRTYKILTALLGCILVFIIGLSRIYLGVHYPSDVIAGFSAGGVWLLVCLMALKMILERRQRQYPRVR